MEAVLIGWFLITATAVSLAYAAGVEAGRGRRR